MSGKVLICDTSEGGGDLYGNCPEHGKFLYFCPKCHDKWAAEHPLTAEAIRMTADPSVSFSKAQRAYRAAKKVEG